MKKWVSLLACTALVVAMLPVQQTLADSSDAVRGEKVAQWVDQANGIAKVTMAVDNDMEKVVQTVQTKIVLVLDRSNSMDNRPGGWFTDTKMTLAKNAAKAFTDRILAIAPHQGDIQISVVSFGNLAERPIGFSSDANAIKNAINTVNTGGLFDIQYTNIQAGIHRAQAGLNTVDEPNEYIILLSDGAPTYSYQVAGVTGVIRNGNCTGGILNLDHGSNATWLIDGMLGNPASITDTLRIEYCNYENSNVRPQNGSLFTNNFILDRGDTYGIECGHLGRFNCTGYPANHRIPTVYEAQLARGVHANSVNGEHSKIFTIGYDLGGNTDAIQTMREVASEPYEPYFNDTNDVEGIFEEIASTLEEELTPTTGFVTDNMGSNANINQDASSPAYNFEIITDNPSTYPIMATFDENYANAPEPMAATVVEVASDKKSLKWNLADEDGFFKKGQYVLTYYIKLDPTAFGQGDYTVYTNNGAEVAYADINGDPQVCDMEDPSLSFNRGPVTPAAQNISGTKVLNSDTATVILVAGDFNFSLAGDASCTATRDAITAGNVVIESATDGVATATNVVDGAFDLGNVTFKEVGTYKFVVNEIVPTPKLDGMTYDEAERKITVVVGYNQPTHSLVVSSIAVLAGEESNGSIIFTNSYEEPEIVEIDRKSVV